MLFFILWNGLSPPPTPQGNHGLVLDFTASGKYPHHALPANGKRLLFYISFILWNSCPPPPPPNPKGNRVWVLDNSRGKIPSPTCVHAREIFPTCTWGGGEVGVFGIREKGWGSRLKGVWHVIVDFRFFPRIRFPLGPFFRIFTKIRGEIHIFGAITITGVMVTGDHWCCWRRWLNLVQDFHRFHDTGN